VKHFAKTFLQIYGGCISFASSILNPFFFLYATQTYNEEM